jgi:EAL and modified HD-GYP domain-containing signal transduction protein
MTPFDTGLMSNSTCFVSRRAIFNPSMKVAAYDLQSNFASMEETIETLAPEPESIQALFEMFSDPGLDLVIGDRTGLVTMTPPAMAAGLWKYVPPDRVMIGLLPIDNQDASAQLAGIAAEGYSLVVDESQASDFASLLSSGKHIVKIDVTKFAPDDLIVRMDQLRRYKSKILADRIDTYDDLEFCKSLRFDWFQGNFLSRPASRQKEIPVNRLAMMRLLSKLQDPDAEIPEIEKLAAQDVSLSYKLLRYANSAAVSLPRSVTSVGHAVRLVGLNTMRSWSSALLLSAVDSKPRELMTVALIRARMCELLGQSIPNADKDSFHTAGLLSVLDAILDTDMVTVLAELPLSQEINDALIHRSGSIGEALRCTLAYEQADWDHVEFSGIASDLIRSKYWEAVSWSRKITENLLN